MPELNRLGNDGRIHGMAFFRGVRPVLPQGTKLVPLFLDGLFRRERKRLVDVEVIECRLKGVLDVGIIDRAAFFAVGSPRSLIPAFPRSTKASFQHKL